MSCMQSKSALGADLPEERFCVFIASDLNSLGVDTCPIRIKYQGYQVSSLWEHVSCLGGGGGGVMEFCPELLLAMQDMLSRKLMDCSALMRRCFQHMVGMADWRTVQGTELCSKTSVRTA